MKTATHIITLAATALAGISLLAAQFTPDQKIRMAEVAIAQLYVDTVDEDKLAEDAIRGMLEKLDPHSSYTTPEETREFNEPLEGNFSGIGISFNIDKDTLYVIETISGGPAESVGLLGGDRIIAVNDTAIAGVKMKRNDIMKRLRGPKGTKVKVNVLRHSGKNNDTIPFTITRADIPIFSVDAAYMADPHTGYIRINRFAADTHKEVAKALRDLKKQGMTQLILDLTDNGGGYLISAVDLLGEFLPQRSLAVYTQGRASDRQDLYTSSGLRAPLFSDGRLVVMTNQYSASASEITAGALQDYDRGLIVGRRSFGKGLVQRPIPFPDGSMIRLTVAHYCTPAGRDIQKPYRKGDARAYENDILDRLNSGELMHEDSIKHVDSLRFSTLNLHRDIYGGGGIYPDRFVALDTTKFTKYYRNVMAKGILNSYAIHYVDDHRKELRKKYKTDNQFVEQFEVTDEMLREIVKMADEEKVDFNEEEFERSIPLFRMIIKGLIGRNVYENATYHKVYNQGNEIFREALRLINSDDYDRILSPQ